MQKDFYLRRKMDEDGYLPISLIAGFPRVRTLTSDVELIMAGIKKSDKIEISADELKVSFFIISYESTYHIKRQYIKNMVGQEIFF